MRSAALERIGWAVLLALAVAMPCSGAVTLVLKDGQLLEGSEVQRDGDLILLTLAEGQTIPFPSAVVTEIRIHGEGEARPQPGEGAKKPPVTGGVRESPATTVAGDPIEPAHPRDQLAVFGEPKKWQGRSLEPEWHPQSDWELDPKKNNNWNPSTWVEGAFDPTWVPRSDWDDKADILAGSRSKWVEPRDRTWRPTDGWRKTGTSFAVTPSGAGPLWSGWSSLQGAPPATVAAAGTVGAGTRASSGSPGPASDPTLCALDLPLAPGPRPAIAAPRVRRTGDPRLAVLPFPLWEAEAGEGAAAARVVYTVSGGSCAMLGGDLERIVKGPPAAGPPVAPSTPALNAVLAGYPMIRFPTRQAKLDFAFAVVLLGDADASGARRADLRLVDSEAALRALTRVEARGCREPSRKRRRGIEAARASFEPPSVEDRPDGSHVRFWTWSSAGGVLARNDVLLGPDARVTLKRSVVAAHAGEHADQASAVLTVARGAQP